MRAAASPTASTPAEAPLVRTERLCREFAAGASRVGALCDVSVEIGRGEFVAVTGPSGSGKSTFMNLLGCLDRPTSGRYWLGGEDVGALGEARRAALRARVLGFVFQSFHLLPRASALENVELPMLYARIGRRERRERAAAMLARVGLSHRLGHRPSELSGGQQQRVAVARALVADPALILADEPTGALDQRTGAELMDLFGALNGEGLTIVMVTHDAAVARRARRVVRFGDGRVLEAVPPSPGELAA